MRARADDLVHSGWIATFALAATLALVGCATDAERDPDEYRKVLDAGVPMLEDPSPDEPLTLERAMAVANRRDETLSRSGEDYVQALLQKNRIVANFLPTLTFAPNFTIADRPPGTSSTTAAALGGAFIARGNTMQRFEAPVVGDVNLFRGMGDVADLRAAEAMIAARRELLLDLQSTVLLNVAQAFYAVLRAEETVEVLQHSLATEEARLADVEARAQNGLATRLTVAQTRAQVAATRVDLVAARNDVRNGRTTLALVIGVPLITQPLRDTLTVPDVLAPTSEQEQAAVDQRAGIKAARAAMDAARHEVDVAMSQYYPSVTLDVTGFLYREDWADASRWNALLGVSVPIFSAGRIEADVRIAWSRLRQAALDESATRRGVLHDVRVAYDNLESSRRRITELEEEVAAAREARDQAADAFANGLAVNLDVLTADESLRQAELALTGARFDRSVFFLDLVRAKGELVKSPEAERGDSPHGPSHDPD